MAHTAILIIDLQKEFFSPDGILGKKCVEKIPLVSNILSLVEYGKSNQHKIIWIKAIYDHTIKMENPSHFGKNPCCAKGSDLSEFCEEIEDYTTASDSIIITKNCYSAFAHKYDGTTTGLLGHLRSNCINNLLVCGVTLNNCVKHTALDAVELGFNVKIVADCVGMAKGKDISESIAIFLPKTIGIINSSDVASKISILEEESSYLIPSIMCTDKDFFDLLKNEIQWQNMYNKHKPVPRLVAIQGKQDLYVDREGKITETVMPLYRHPTDKQPTATQWTKTVKHIKDCLEEFLGQSCGQRFNHCLVQYYRSGTDHISEHSDKTLDIDPKSLIVNVSFGATRTMILKNKITKEKIKIPLANNSAFVMSLKTNNNWLHSIKQDKRPEKIKNNDERSFNGERISLTFRWIATQIYSDGRICGQGARKDGLQFSPWFQNTKMLNAFRKENIQTNFNWDKYYGDGFNNVDLSIGKNNGYILTKESVIMVKSGFYKCTNDVFNDFCNKSDVRTIHLENKKLVEKELENLYFETAHKIVLTFGNFKNSNLIPNLMYHCQQYFVLTEFSEHYQNVESEYLIDDWLDLFQYNSNQIFTLNNQPLKLSKLLMPDCNCKDILTRKLFIENESVASRRVLMLLYDVGIHFECHTLNIGLNANEAELTEFLAISPRGKTPVMVEPNGKIITEPLALLQYIDATYNNSKLLKNDFCSEILSKVQESEILFGICGLTKKSSDQIMTSIETELGFWEMCVANSKYIVGNKISLADYAFYPILSDIVHGGFKLDLFPNLLKYNNKMSQRYACKLSKPVGWEK